MKTLNEIMNDANAEISKIIFSKASKLKRIRRRRVWICSKCNIQTSTKKGRDFYLAKGCNLIEYLVNQSTGEKEKVN